MAVLTIAALLAVSPLIAPAAQAAGCLKGAAVGGMAGHYMGHHGWLGAGAGCVIGHHEAVKRDREEGYRDHDRY
jgi:outer membrane lipoprotein SlyB